MSGPQVVRPSAITSLLSEVSASMLVATPERIGVHIESALRRIGEAGGFDRVGVRWFTTEGRPTETHAWTAPPEQPWPPPLVVDRMPWASERLLAGASIVCRDLRELPDEASIARDALARLGVRSLASLPLCVDDQLCGVLHVATTSAEHPWQAHAVENLRTLGAIVANAYARCRAFRELSELKEQLAVERDYLSARLRQTEGSPTVVGTSPAIARLRQLAIRVATTDATVLLTGETGVGKEVIARFVHEQSRREGPLVSVNCAALPAELIESELFGHEKGAFSGAHALRRGRLELADRGTLFLDEVADLPLSLQPKLLRVLQERQFERVGGSTTITFHGRFIAATNRDLGEAVERGEFRADLRYRLDVVQIAVPPLRERQEDIPELVQHFVARHGRRLGRSVERVSDRLLSHLRTRDWPGNVRELESVVQRALIGGAGGVLDLDDLVAFGGDRQQAQHASLRLDDVEREHIVRVLGQAGWVIEGPDGAAELLGLAPSTLRSRMTRLGVRRG